MFDATYRDLDGRGRTERQEGCREGAKMLKGYALMGSKNTYGSSKHGCDALSTGATVRRSTTRSAVANPLHIGQQ